MEVSALSSLPLLPGIRSRIVNNINGLAMHILEAGFETKDRPCILLLHGFPELAYSWREIMLPLAAAGYHVVAPDQRGYGRTDGWDDAYDGDLDSFRLPNLVRDALGLVSALGYRSVAAVIGHDFGSIVTAYCAVIRPDVFRSAVLMSAPFAGPPPLPFNTAEEAAQPEAPTPSRDQVFQDLAKLDRPRKHYQQYYQTREANDNMWKAPQGIHDFLRAYFHFKSADWKQNRPFKLSAFTATELAKMPTYYIMDLGKGMAETAAEQMPSALPSLKRFQAARSMCRPISFRARAIGASIRRPARLREWKPAPAPNGAAPIWLMVRDTGYSRSSQKKSFGCCCDSSADREEGTLPLRVIFVLGS
jgi:pimeloyl-ACP methyl ester carboxylesterase